MADEGQATFETRKDAGDGGKGTFRLWMQALKLAGETEKDWRKWAQDASDRYRDEKNRRGGRFNILYSTMQTMAPTVYNSTPKPDVRRRFNDEDVTGKVASQAFERSLSHSMDEYDFDHVIKSDVHDMLLRGRGISEVVYDPIVGDEVREQTRIEHVQWDDFRIGPGKKWQDVPWCAIRFRITRQQAIALSPKHGPTVRLDHTEKDADKENKDVPDVFKRLTVWKIWDKEKRQIVFIAPSHKEGPFAVEEDQLNLTGFFPFPRPLYDIPDSSSLVPLVPYEMYRDQAEELDLVSNRIKRLIRVLRWRGIRPAQIEELDRLKDAEDGELIPSESASTVLAMSQTSGDLNKAIWLMPIEDLIVVIRELVIQREAIKQVIFEISGISDILRGETDPGETLGAQQIKAQFGSLRMQARQQEIQRYVRDLMRIKAEIIGEQYSADTLRLITGIELPPPEVKAQAQQEILLAEQTQQPVPEERRQVAQAPTWDDVKAVMASDALRSFKVDIETDSTIEGDIGRAQQNMAGFVEGLGAFASAIGPSVQAGVMPLDIVADLFTGFARNFKLGRQAEDALERLGQLSRQPQEQGPDPEQLKLQAEQETRKAEMGLKQDELDFKKQELQFRREFEQNKKAVEISQRDTDLEMRREELDMKRREFDGTEAGRFANELDGIRDGSNQALAGIEQAMALAAEALQQIAALREDLSAPKSIDVQRTRGKVTGGIVTQGSLRSEIVLN